MAWSLDKHYLADLAAVGVPIVPTDFVPADSGIDLAARVASLGPLVVKPAISAAAKDTFRLMTEADAAALDFAALNHGRSFLIQPFLPEIMTAGEWSLVYLDGEYSHAVWKTPAKGHWLVQDELGGSVASGEPSAPVKVLADLAVARLSDAFARQHSQGYEMPLYGRVDVIVSGGKALIGELELVEPELFFLTRSATGNVANERALGLFRRGLGRLTRREPRLV